MYRQQEKGIDGDESSNMENEQVAETGDAINLRSAFFGAYIRKNPLRYSKEECPLRATSRYAPQAGVR